MSDLEEQKRIAMAYEARAFAAMNNPEEFDKVLAEFAAEKATWK